MTPKCLALAAIAVVSVPQMVSGQISGLSLFNEIAKRPELSQVSRYISIKSFWSSLTSLICTTAEMLDLKSSFTTTARILMAVEYIYSDSVAYRKSLS